MNCRWKEPMTGLLLCLMLSGCSRISHTAGMAVETRPDAAPALPEVPLSLPAGENDPYEQVVQFYQAEDDSVTAAQKQMYAYRNQYALYDMNGDGVLELFVKLGYSEADYQYTVWTLDESGAPAQTGGNFSGAHTALYGAEGTAGVFTNSCHMGSQSVRQYTLSADGIFSETVVYAETLTDEEVSLCGFYALSAEEGYFVLEEQPIGHYVYAESAHQAAETGVPTLVQYQAQLDALRTAVG